jgi:hypothetical protein
MPCLYIVEHPITLYQDRLGTELAEEHRTQKTASFFEFSLCLSRACLGKMMHFIYKWLKNAVFRTHTRIRRCPCACRNPTGKKTPLLQCHFKLNRVTLPRQARDRHRKGKHSTQRVAFSHIDIDEEQVPKRHLLSHLYTKCIILPRQARDKHRENSRKRAFP